MATTTDDTVTLGPDEIEPLGRVAERLRDVPTGEDFDQHGNVTTERIHTATLG